ncbi:MAG: insulinase family protein [Holosporaceae bacterium]|jgi:predicted Zn-dependent peptidase|nr:insulinase family protein [Holosporaceae bacterium]
MFKKFIVLFGFLVLFNSEAERYRGASFQKLENGLSVIFVDTPRADSLLVVLCVSSGSTDETDKRGVANLLCHMFSRKLKEKADADPPQYRLESNSYVGYDQSEYYFYGKTENLDGFINNLGATFSGFTFSSSDLNESKKIIEQQISEDQQIDRNRVRHEARKSLYWHSGYGSSCDVDSLRSISEEDVKNFKNRNYVNGRATLIIAGKVDKKRALEMVNKCFSKEKIESTINRLQEPPHHGSTTRITRSSSQVSVPIIEMYWRIPNYRNEKGKALAAEIFINHLGEVLQKNLVETQKIAASISFSYSFWNHDCGDFCMTITSKNSDKVEEVVTAVLSEIKYIASEKITEEQAKKAARKLYNANNVFNIEVDVIDFVNWISKKIGACYDFDFLKSYDQFIDKFDLNEVHSQAKAIFRNDPCVISILTPAEKKNAN